MLFFAMNLINTKPDAAMTNEYSLYSTAKGFLAGLEASGYVSLMSLQAWILVALFEYSHAIYPAAWMTVGACARYSEVLGLSYGKDKLGILPKCVRLPFLYTHHLTGLPRISNQPSDQLVRDRRTTKGLLGDIYPRSGRFPWQQKKVCG
jgi:hypothetical protein